MTETSPEAVEREVGSEPTKCPNCGKTLKVEERGDGSTTFEACSKCFPAAPKAEVAAAQKELDAQMPRETGTDTTGANA